MLPAQLQRCLLAVKVTGGNPQLTCAFFCWSISCLFSGTGMNYANKQKKKAENKENDRFCWQILDKKIKNHQQATRGQFLGLTKK